MTPTNKNFDSRLIFWFSLSLTFATIFGIMELQRAFSSEYVVQDDARQHVFWMRRFLEPELFPNDLIADYYQSVAPVGYASVYHLMASVGIDPIFLSKLLPIVLGLIATGYCFGVCLQMLPVPIAGFIATLLLNQNLLLKDDLVSGTARAFMYPLFFAFLYYLLRRSLLPSLATIALQGLFYPSSVLICAGILTLRLWRWKHGRPRLSQDRSDYIFCATGLGVALLMLLPLALKSSEFGSAIAAAEARAMPEFFELGRSRFFVNNPIEFWLYADRSGIFPFEWSLLPYKYFPLMLCIGLLLPILQRYPSRFPLVRQVKSSVTLLPQIALVSLGLFLWAHALLFKLYLPSRYTHYSVRILMALGAGIVLTVILDAIFLWAGQRTNPRLHGRRVLAVVLTALLGIALVSYPIVVLKLQRFPFLSTSSYVVGTEPELYKFFREQPKDILIASLSHQASDLPVFAQRSILVSREHAIPYHVGYYRQIRQRIADLIRAQYSQDLAEVQNFIQKYGVDFLLVDRLAFTPKYMATNRLVRQFLQKQMEDDRVVRVTTEAVARLEQGTIPALSSVMERCSAFETKNLVVLQATCITKLPKEWQSKS